MTNVIQARAHLMQQVSDHVRRGYRHWASGTVPLERARAWSEKAIKLYEVEQDRNRRARAKKAGRGSAYLLFYPLDRSPETKRLGWILLVTDGDHPAHRLEKLCRAELSPVTLFGYNLAREPKAGVEHPPWTWRMSRDTYEAWRERIIDVIRRGSDLDLQQVLKVLRGAPGFAGVRRQIKALHRLIRYEWSARHGRATRPPTLPRIWFAPRMQVIRVSLSAYLQAHKRAQDYRAAESLEKRPAVDQTKTLS